jgi:hypothetical protein
MASSGPHWSRPCRRDVQDSYLAAGERRLRDLWARSGPSTWTVALVVAAAPIQQEGPAAVHQRDRSNGRRWFMSFPALVVLVMVVTDNGSVAASRVVQSGRCSGGRPARNKLRSLHLGLRSVGVLVGPNFGRL